MAVFLLSFDFRPHQGAVLIRGAAVLAYAAITAARAALIIWSFIDIGPSKACGPGGISRHGEGAGQGRCGGGAGERAPAMAAETQGCRGSREECLRGCLPGLRARVGAATGGVGGCGEGAGQGGSAGGAGERARALPGQALRRHARPHHQHPRQGGQPHGCNQRQFPMGSH